MSDDSIFGYSLSLANGDIVLAESNNTRTLQLVHGKANLLQALNLRVLTPSGSDQLNTTYGLSASEIFTQPGTVSQAKEYIKLSLIQTLVTDPRVHDVRDVIFSDDPRYQSQAEIDTTRRSRFWSVEAIIDTVDTQTTTLLLNIGV